MKFSFFIALFILSNNIQASIEDLTTDNSSFSTAQAVGSLDIDGEILEIEGVRGSLFRDDDNADFYSFQVSDPSTLIITAYVPYGPLELPFEPDLPVLGLYDTTGLQLANDDDGSDGYDPYLAYFISTPGTYIAAISGYDDFDFIGGGDTDFAYTLELSADTSVIPVPATIWLFGSALVGLFGLSRQKSI